MSEISDIAGLLLGALIVFTGGMAIKGHKRARRIFGTGLALLLVEAFAILLSGLNDEYFHCSLLQQGLRIYFEWLNLFVVINLGIFLIFTGLIIGLLARTTRESAKP